MKVCCESFKTVVKDQEISEADLTLLFTMAAESTNKVVCLFCNCEWKSPQDNAYAPIV